jgi:DNA polymerase
MADPTDRTALLALLDWYRALGAAEPLADTPIDWLAKGNAPPGAAFEVQAGHEARAARIAAPEPPAPAAERRPFRAGADPASVAASTAARDAGDLDELVAALARFEGCGLKATAKNLCVYRGARRAPVMLIGEAPGRDEDLQGKPFVGRAGQLLDRMLASIGLREQHVHITNIVYWRPPGNRTPTPQEAHVCRPFLERQVELVAPDLIVLLGGAAAKHLFDAADGILRIRGKVREIEIGAARRRAIATLHPAYLLRTPAAKRLAWRDLLTIDALLRERATRGAGAR